MDTIKTKKICLTAAVLGSAGLILRMLLYRMGTDHKGLLVHWHPLTLGLLAAAAVMVIAVVITAAGMKKEFCAVPVGRLAAAGNLCFGLGIWLTVLPAGSAALPVTVLGLLSGAAMAAGAWSQWRGRRPWFLTYGLTCIFLGLYLVGRYQVWSKNPQFMDYTLALLAGVALMLYAYQMAAGCLDRCSRRSWLVLGALGSFAALAGSYGGDTWALCLGGGLWMLSGLWTGTGEGTVKP